MAIPTSMLNCTCTISRPTTSGVDAAGQPVRTGQTSTTGIACFFDDARMRRISQDLTLDVSNPLLIVGPDVTVAPGDEVTAVTRTADSVVLAAGPLRVVGVEDPGGQGDHLELELERVG